MILEMYCYILSDNNLNSYSERPGIWFLYLFGIEKHVYWRSSSPVSGCKKVEGISADNFHCLSKV